MATNDKQILLIARNFPPMGGVGTRRWSKFSKYLAQRGYTIHVITIDYKNVDEVNWLHDIQHPNIVLHRLKSVYPKYLLKHKKRGFFEKKLYEVFRLSYKFTSNWMDNAQGWEKVLIPYARKLIKEQSIKNVIVTAAPCSVAYMASIIKVENPYINLIVDFRDKWNDEPQYAYGSGIRSFKKKEWAVYMELQVMLHADKISVTTESIKDLFSGIYKTCKDKYTVLTNGYDSTEYERVELTESKTLKVVYLGSLLGQRGMGIQLIADAIKQLNNQFFDHQFKVDIYGIPASGFQNPNPEVFTFMPMFNPNKISEVLGQYHIGLSVLDPAQSEIFGTKVFDYMATHKGILHIANQGELYKLLKEKGQYVSDYDVDNMANALLQLKKDFENNDITQPDFAEFDLKHITSKLETLLV